MQSFAVTTFVGLNFQCIFAKFFGYWIAVLIKYEIAQAESGNHELYPSRDT